MPERHHADAFPALARQTRWLYALALVSVLLAWGPASWVSDYLHDDHPAVLNNPLVTWPPPVADIFSHSYFGPDRAFAHMPLSRPLVTLSFAFEQGLGLTSSAARHAVNLSLLALICGLIGQLLVLLASRTAASPGRVVAWAVSAVVVFAWHPVHASVVMSVAYRPELLALLFALLSTRALLAILDGRDALPAAAWGALAFAAGLLSKESAVCVLAPWVALAWSRPGGLRRARGLLVAGGALALAFFAWRHAVLGGVLVAGIPAADNPLVSVVGTTRVLAGLEGVALAAAHLFIPWGGWLAPDYSFDALAVPSGLTAAATGGALVVVALAAAVFWGLTGPRRARGGGLLAAGALWLAAFYLPVSNLLFAIPVRFAERLLFAPSVVACVLLAWPIGVWLGPAFEPDGGAAARPGAPVQPRARLRAGLRSLAVGALLLASLAQALVASWAWTDELALFQHGAARQPRSVKMQYNLGRLLVERRREAEAIPHLQAALALRPSDWDARVTLLEAHFRLGRCAESLALVEAMEAAGAARPRGLPGLARRGLLIWAQRCGDARRARKYATIGPAAQAPPAPATR